MPSTTQTEILARCDELRLPVLGVTDAALVPGADGVVVMLSNTNPRLKPLAEDGYRLTPSGRHHTIIEEAHRA